MAADGDMMGPQPEAAVSDDPMSKYWAAAPAEKLVGTIDEKERRYFSAVDRRGLGDLWRLAYCYAFGMPTKRFSGTTHALSFTGPQGEYMRFRVSEVRSYVKQQNIMAQGQRPAFQALAINSDWQTLSQIEIAQSVIDYIYRRNVGEKKEREALESDGYFGAGYGWMRWDHEAGDEVTIAPERPIPGGPEGAMAPLPITVKSGAPKLMSLYPWEFFQEPYARDPLWGCVRERVSKWELMAAFPDKAEQIMGMGGEANSGERSKASFAALFLYDLDAVTDDDVIVKHFYHKRCGSMPNGRYVGAVGGIALWDRPCPVSEGIPVKELCSGKYFGTQFGYADSWDLFAIQEAIEMMASDTLTNYGTYGRQFVSVEEGTSYDVKQLSAGLRLFKRPKGTQPPIAVTLAAMPPGKEAFVEYLHGRLEAISGLNAVSRGQSTKNITSGQMAALYHSIAVEYQSARQAALDTWREEIANMMLDFVRTYAEEPFLVQIAGEDEMPYMQQFTAQDVMGVKRVQIVTSNPALRSIATRFEIFNAVNELPKEDRAAAIEMLTSGNTKEFTRADRSSLLRIRWENQQLAQGDPEGKVVVLATDDPIAHLAKHRAELEARSEMMAANPQVRNAYLKHIFEHLKVFYESDPVLMGLLGNPSPPPRPEALGGDPAAFAQGAAMAGQQAGSIARAEAGKPAGGSGGGAPKALPTGGGGPDTIEKPNPSKPPASGNNTVEASPN